MTPTVVGFVTLDEADAFFETRLGSEDWFASGTDKVAALHTAYRDLSSSNLFLLPTSSEDPATKYAQLEQALFLVQQGSAIDARAGIQAQHVKQSSVVQEAYEPPAGFSGPPLSVRAVGWLRNYQRTGSAAHVRMEREDD